MGNENHKRIQALQAELSRVQMALASEEKSARVESREPKRKRPPLKRAKILLQIETLRGKEKFAATRLLNTPRHRRRGSRAFARQHPHEAVSEKDKLLMRQLHQLGISFRALEEIFHLYPNSGNDAQRCVREAETIHRRSIAQEVSRRRALTRGTRTA